MRILVTTIPFTGMKIDAPISKADLNARLREGRDSDSVVFEEAPMANLSLSRAHGGVLVKGVISGICKQDCSSCGDLVAHKACATIDWILQGDSDRAAADDDLDDPGVIVYQGEHVDLEVHLQEALILSMSPFWHPPRDSHERCLTCHRDCSKRIWRSVDTAGVSSARSELEQSSSTLGGLLKGALKRKRVL